MPSSRDLPPITTPFFPKLFIQNQFRAKPQLPPKNTNLSGKTVIITGGNSGLGFESARQLLSFKLTHLILAVRNISKGEAAAKKLNAAYPKAKIEVFELDMASYDSIRAFVLRVENQVPRIDIVILNAGRFKMSYSTIASTGHEELVQINYLSTVLLCILLLPILKVKAAAGSPAHLTIVNAALSLDAKFPNRNKIPLIPSFDDPKSFDGSDWYNTSKLLAHMFLWNLVDYVSADDVIVNIVDPGFVGGTELGRDFPKIVRFFGKGFEAATARTTKEGASTYVDAVINKGKESHGCFIMGWKIKPFAAMLYTAEGREVRVNLWRETMDEFNFANVRGILESLKKQ